MMNKSLHLADASDEEAMNDLRRRLSKAHAATQVLDVLSSTTFPDCDVAPALDLRESSKNHEEANVSPEEDIDPFFIALKRKSQRENKQKRGKRVRQKVEHGPRLSISEQNAFRAFGVDVPKNREGAERLCQSVLDDLLQVLKVSASHMCFSQDHYNLCWPVVS
jgi:hypothetical protein